MNYVKIRQRGIFALKKSKITLNPNKHNRIFYISKTET